MPVKSPDPQTGVLLFTWQTHWVSFVALVAQLVVLAWYLTSVRRVVARGARWSAFRALCFVVGVRRRCLRHRGRDRALPDVQFHRPCSPGFAPGRRGAAAFGAGRSDHSGPSVVVTAHGRHPGQSAAQRAGTGRVATDRGFRHRDGLDVRVLPDPALSRVGTTPSPARSYPPVPGPGGPTALGVDSGAGRAAQAPELRDAVRPGPPSGPVQPRLRPGGGQRDTAALPRWQYPG